MVDLTKPDLCDLEIELLRDLNGEKTTITGWGSWMTSAIECLHGYRLVDRVMKPLGISYIINDAGKTYLAGLQQDPRQ